MKTLSFADFCVWLLQEPRTIKSKDSSADKVELADGTVIYADPIEDTTSYRILPPEAQTVRWEQKNSFSAQGFIGDLHRVSVTLREPGCYLTVVYSVHGEPLKRGVCEDPEQAYRWCEDALKEISDAP